MYGTFYNYVNITAYVVQAPIAWSYPVSVKDANRTD